MSAEKLTEAQRRVLELISRHERGATFNSTNGTEAACQLDAMGYAFAQTDEAHSMGFIVARITDAGRAALASPDSGRE